MLTLENSFYFLFFDKLDLKIKFLKKFAPIIRLHFMLIIENG